MKRAFVIGNGESRVGVNLAELRYYGIIFGCNAIYREFMPDYLIVVDPAMKKEVQAAVINPANQLLTGRGRGWSAGPTAVEYATRGADEIYLLGFDLYGTADNKINNIYKGTPNYLSEDAEATYCGNWINQLHTVFLENKGIKFFRVGRKDDPWPVEWQDLGNVSFISYIEMWERLKRSNHAEL